MPVRPAHSGAAPGDCSGRACRVAPPRHSLCPRTCDWCPKRMSERNLGAQMSGSAPWAFQAIPARQPGVSGIWASPNVQALPKGSQLVTFEEDELDWQWAWERLLEVKGPGIELALVRPALLHSPASTEASSWKFDPPAQPPGSATRTAALQPELHELPALLPFVSTVALLPLCASSESQPGRPSALYCKRPSLQSATAGMLQPGSLKRSPWPLCPESWMQHWVQRSQARNPSQTARRPCWLQSGCTALRDDEA
mmetsp:Transcript_7013/g.11921  ORF Transcript_7013/g.11921 Transcript_7013/m.11921 type:complete len:254 (-) Transcript_7013:50-811(-)